MMFSGNVSHCFWVMDVLKSMENNSSFSFIKSMLSSDTIQSTIWYYLISIVIKEMKEQVEETQKVEDVTVFKDYLELIVC